MGAGAGADPSSSAIGSDRQNCRADERRRTACSSRPKIAARRQCRVRQDDRARYDGDPRIGFVQLGLLGFWGEWHTYPYDGYAHPWVTDWSGVQVVDVH